MSYIKMLIAIIMSLFMLVSIALQVVYPKNTPSLPLYDEEADMSYECNNGVSQYFYDGVRKKYFDEYNEILQNSDFALCQSNTANNNWFYTYSKDNLMLHLWYNCAEKELTVTLDNLFSSVYTKPNEESLTEITDNSFAVMTLDYSKYTCAEGCEPKYDNNGMCYILTLEDGRFIVYDGGYENTNDSEIIYEFLLDNNKREGKPTVAAWILTHSHGDHYGAFKKFTKEHSDDIIVENIVNNTGISKCYSGGKNSYLEYNIDSVIENNYAGANEIHPHIGQKLYFGNIEIEIMYTHEQFHFNSLELESENSASLVSRIRMDGVTLLITADATERCCDEMTDIYSRALKSDILQINHHGNGGLTKEFYSKVKPKYALWSTSQSTLEKRVGGVPYDVGMPSKYVAELNKKIFDDIGADKTFCADGNVEIMTFGENKKVSITQYEINPELLPSRD